MFSNQGKVEPFLPNPRSVQTVHRQQSNASYFPRLHYLTSVRLNEAHCWAFVLHERYASEAVPIPTHSALFKSPTGGFFAFPSNARKRLPLYPTGTSANISNTAWGHRSKV